MAKPRPWTVSPHGPIERLEDNLWVVEGTVPTPGGIRRRMAIIKRSDGSLLFFHAIPLADEALAEVLAWGTPAVVVVGHDQHCIDAAPFAEKLGLTIFGPAANAAKLRARLPLAGTLAELPADPGIMRSGDRVTVMFSDCIQHSPPEGMAFPLRWLGFSGGPKVVPVFRFLFMNDRAALKAHLDRLASTPGLVRVLPFHGTVVTTDAAGSLRTAASTL